MAKITIKYLASFFTGSYNDLTDVPAEFPPESHTHVTSEVAPSLNRNYVTDSEKIVVGNTSNTNSGDETKSTIETLLGAATAINDGFLKMTDWTIFNNKQTALISGSNLRTVNGNTLLGSSDIPFEPLLPQTYTVNLSTGNDLTGTFQNFNNPFLTYQAAYDDAVTLGVTGKVTFLIYESGTVNIEKTINIDLFETEISCQNGADISTATFDTVTYGSEVIIGATTKKKVIFNTEGKIIIGDGVNGQELCSTIAREAMVEIYADEVESKSLAAIGIVGNIIYKSMTTRTNDNLYFIKTVIGGAEYTNVDLGNVISTTTGAGNYGGLSCQLIGSTSGGNTLGFTVKWNSVTSLNSPVFAVGINLQYAGVIIDEISIGDVNIPGSANSVAILYLNAGTEVDTSRVNTYNTPSMVGNELVLEGGGDFSGGDFLCNTNTHLKNGTFILNRIVRNQGDADKTTIFERTIIGVNNLTFFTSSVPFDFATNTNPFIKVIGYCELFSNTGTPIDLFFNFINKTNVKIDCSEGTFVKNDDVMYNVGVTIGSMVLFRPSSESIHPFKLKVENNLQTQEFSIPFDESLVVDADSFDLTGNVFNFLPKFIDKSGMSYLDAAAASTAGVPSGALYWDTTLGDLVEL